MRGARCPVWRTRWRPTRGSGARTAASTWGRGDSGASGGSRRQLQRPRAAQGRTSRRRDAQVVRVVVVVQRGHESRQLRVEAQRRQPPPKRRARQRQEWHQGQRQDEEQQEEGLEGLQGVEEALLLVVVVVLLEPMLRTTAMTTSWRSWRCLHRRRRLAGRGQGGGSKGCTTEAGPLRGGAWTFLTFSSSSGSSLPARTSS